MNHCYKTVFTRMSPLAALIATAVLTAPVHAQTQLTDESNFWNGQNTTPSGAVLGGDGTWSSANGNWSNANGSASGQYNPSSLLIFSGTPGVVNVDAAGAPALAVEGGMQFAVDGYVVQGDGLVLGSGVNAIQVGNGTPDGVNFSATIASALSGTGSLELNDLGTLVLTGVNTFSGSTSVLAGTLMVNGSLTNSTVTVMDGARIGGTGTISRLIVRTGATVALGDGAIGTLNVSNTVGFFADSVYEVKVNAEGQADRINAGGSTTSALNGTVMVLASPGNYAPSTRYTIFSSTNGINGTFASVTSNLAFLDPSLSYDSNSAYLTLTRNDLSFAGVGNTFNQRAAATALDALGTAHTLWQATIQMDAPSAQAAFDQVSGEIHASAKTALLESSRFVRDVALDRLRSNDGENSVSWVRLLGSRGTSNSDGNAAPLDRNTNGVFIGADGQFSKAVRLGMFGGYSRTTFTGSRGEGNSGDVHIGAYIGGQWTALALRGGAAYTMHDINITRTVAIDPVSDTLQSSDSGANMSQVFGEFAYRLNASIEPFANLAYANLATSQFVEKEGISALASLGGRTKVSFSTVGAHAQSALAFGASTTATAKGTLGWRHAFGDTTPLSTHLFSVDNAFTVAGVPIASNAAVLDLGVDVTLGADSTLSVAYNGQFGSGAKDSGVRADFRMRF
ncbi:MAG: autotransporter domain-containing protein [Pseudomonadales bacterium]|nr:autotransporter domain-containing protein [Pseudomonadales bacterium]